MRVFPLFDSMVTDRPTNGRTDKASYRVACPQLKTSRQSTRHHEIHTEKHAVKKKDSYLRLFSGWREPPLLVLIPGLVQFLLTGFKKSHWESFFRLLSRFAPAVPISPVWRYGTLKRKKLIKGNEWNVEIKTIKNEKKKTNEKWKKK